MALPDLVVRIPIWLALVSWGGAVTVSVGAAIVEDGAGPGQVVANADAALHCAKRAGRNRVEPYAAA